MPDSTDPSIPIRLPDGGPIYVETPIDPATPPGIVAEPWNTATAAIFILIPLVWFFWLKGRYARHPFLVCCLPILLAGGIGGTLYHGMRKYRAFFLMDVIPIYLLGLIAAVYLWIRLGPRLIYLLGMVIFWGLLQWFAQVQLPLAWRINVSYASLAAIVLIPVVLVLVRTKFRHGGWIATALICFAVAWLCRILDIERPPLLPMGTHWLWHIFGACTTAALVAYIYRIEGQSLRPSATK